MFHGPCKDLNELRHLVALLFPIYHAPVLAGEIQKENSAALYKSGTCDIALGPVLTYFPGLCHPTRPRSPCGILYVVRNDY